MNGEIEMVKNVFGIKGKRGCASCQHKSIDYEGVRICNLLGLKVQHKFKCSSWQLSYGLQKAGNAQGVVRHFVTKQTVIE
jgi:hypothetical protein